MAILALIPLCFGLSADERQRDESRDSWRIDRVEPGLREEAVRMSRHGRALPVIVQFVPAEDQPELAAFEPGVADEYARQQVRESAMIHNAREVPPDPEP